MTGELKNGKMRCLTAAAIVVAWALSVVGAIWWASGDRAVALDRIESHSATIADHETRLRLLQERQIEIATNVAWIRNRLENRGPPVAQSLVPDP